MCLILQDKPEQAEDILQKALDKDSAHTETLVNLSVVSQYLGAQESSKRYISQVKDAQPNHTAVARLAEKEQQFEELAAALISNR